MQDKQLVRLTLDMVRPIPLAGFTIAAKIIKQGRMLTTCAVVLSDREGKACINAASIHLKTQVTKELPSAVIARPVFEDAAAGYFPSMPVNHGKPTFAQSVEVAYPPGEGRAPGPTTIWITPIDS